MPDRTPTLCRWILPLAGLAAVGASAEADAPPAAAGSAVEHRALLEDVIELANQAATVGVSPTLGRVVGFGQAEGRNLLWLAPPEALEKPVMRGEQAYFNYGGDKVWPTLQALWGRSYGGSGGWPPDGVIDGSAWTVVDRGDRHVTMRSAVSPHLGIVAERRFELDPAAPVVHIRNRLTRVEPNPFPVHIWTVTQTHTPPAVLLDFAPDRPRTVKPWEPFGKRAAFEPDNPRTLDGEAALYWRLDHEGARKVGTMGAWVAGLYEDVIFLQQTTYHPSGAYPDNSSAQVYSDGNYTELELLSPFVHLQPGQTLENHVVWQLLPVDSGASPEQLLERIDAAVQQAPAAPAEVREAGDE